jgi:hypothetical protein
MRFILFVADLRDDSYNWSDYVAWNDSTTGNNEEESPWKEVAVD